MAKSIYVEEAGGVLEFPDTATPQQMRAYIDRTYKTPAAPAAPVPTGPDESGLLGRAAYGFATGFTDIPSGIASLMMPAEEVAETSAGQFSDAARKYLEETFGIDPTKDPTTAQQAAQILGNVGSFLVPGAGVAKGVALAGKGATAVRAAGMATAAAQGSTLGAASRTQRIQQQLAAGMEISPEEQLAAQRLDGLIGLSEAAPIGRFFGPLTTLLSKVPVSKAPVVEQILKSRLASIAKAGAAEGAQEVASGIANDLVEYGVYNPDVEIGQDLLSNAAGGAFAGSFIESVIQIAAGRKLRPYRQLQEDLRTETQQNLLDAKRGTVANAAERLREFNVEGPVEIVEEEIDNVPTVTLKTKGGNIVGSLPDVESANQAIDLYQKKTGAKVRVMQPAKGPDVFPIKIAGQSFNSMDDIVATQSALRDQFTATNEFLVDPVSIERNAKLKGVAPDFYRKEVQKEAGKMAVKLEKLDEFVRAAAPKVPTPTAAMDIGGGKMRGFKQRGAASLKPMVMTPGPAVWTSVDADIPVTIVDAPVSVDPVSKLEVQKIKLADGSERLVPTKEIVPLTSPKVSLAAPEVDAPKIDVPEIEVAAPSADITTPPTAQTPSVVVETPSVELAAVAEPPSATEPAPIEGPVQAVLDEGLPRPIGAVEQAPEAPVSGIAAIAEPTAPPPSFEEPLASKTGPTPVPVEETAPPPPTVDTAGKQLLGRLPGEPRAVTPKQAVAKVMAPREYTPEQKEYDTKLYGELQKRLDTIATPGVKLELTEMIDTLPGYLVRGNVKKDNTPNGTAVIVELSKGIFDPNKTIDDNVNALLDVLNHEAIHVLRNQLRPIEWQALSRAVQNTKVPGKKYTYLDKAEAVYTPLGLDSEGIIEEAVAEMYKDWVRNRTAPAPTRGPFNRITEFLRRIFRALKSTAYEDVFKSIEAGEVRGRETSVEAPPVSPETRFSAAPINPEEFQSWFGDSKAVDASGRPLTLFHGTPAEFSEFSMEAKRESQFQDSDIGFFFTDNPMAASFFTGSTSRAPSGSVIPVNLSVKKPLVIDMSSSSAVKVDGFPKFTDLALREMAAEKLGVRFPSGSSIRDALIEQGYDGVKVINSSFGKVTPGLAKRIGGQPGKWTVWIALEPTQVKSTLNQFEEGAATSTKFSAAPLYDTEAFRKWSEGNQLVNEDGSPLKLYTGTSKDTIFESFKDSDRGTWVTSDPALASEYALENDSMNLRLEYGPKGREYVRTNTRSRVLPVYASVKNILDLSTREKQDAFYKENKIPTFGGASGYQKEQAAIGRVAKSRGYDAIQWAPNVWAVFDPKKNIKSQFNEFTEKSIAGTKFSAAPLPAYIETKNDTLFAKHDNVSFPRMIFDFLFKPDTNVRTIRTQSHGDIEIGRWTQIGLAGRAAVVDKNAGVTFLEKLLNQKATGNFERMTADYSATVALAMRNRSSHLTAAGIRMGNVALDFARAGDIQSATMKVVEDPDNLLNVAKVLMEPGPTDSRTGEQKDKREVFKSYASAMRSRSLKARGLPVPRELDDTYVNTVIPFTEQNYPEVVEAYKMYQRVNKKLLESAVKAGLIKQAELNSLTQNMDYYGFYHEVYDTAIVPGMSTKTASQFKLRPYTGSQYGNLLNDPIAMMIHNYQFWVDSMAKNLAATKAFEVARQMGEARILGTGEDPKEVEGEAQQVMFYKKNGVQMRFAVKDPLLVTALGSDDRIDMGGFMKVLGLPTQWIRESVTRDPGFMVANLLRDTLSSWITSGEDITPFLGTMRGFKKALKKEVSFQALMGRGVVGSYDLAMLQPAELASKIGRIATPKNVHVVPNLEAGAGAAIALWDRLGALSEASDAATRIAVYESAINQGMSEAEAAFRAIEIMDFSRRGGSAVLAVFTKIIPFLNARIQGLDVLWQAGRAGARVATGRAMGEKDANLGKKFLVRGGMLAAMSMLLEMWNSDDEDYENLDEYIKTGNLLIPLNWLGMKGEFIAIPKPFEAGLLFSTFPQQFYKTMAGDASTRENLNLFTSQFGATFGVNWVPQALLPAAEVWWNIDFYTGLPLISEGKARLAPELQYNTGTSTLSMLLGKIPINYNLTTGRFEGTSPIVIENLIEGYTGPIGSMVVDFTGVLMDLADAGPERMPTDLTKLPVVKRVFIDAEKKNPKVVTQAYELFQIADEANRTFSRLKQIGDVEAVKDYVDENRDILTYRKYIFKMVDGLNKLNAQERRIESDPEMTADEKREAMRKLREMRVNIASTVDMMNEKLGR